MTAIPASPPEKSKVTPDRSARAKFQYQDSALFGVVLLLLIVGTILKGSEFLSKDNIFNVLRQGSVVGCLAIGMTFVIATAGIDLSAGSMVAATGLAGGLLVEHGHRPFGLV